MDWSFRTSRLERNARVIIALILVMIITVWRLSYFHKEKSHKGLGGGSHSPSSLRYEEHLIQTARSKAWCIKPARGNEYIICTRLPYTSIECGECRSQCNAGSNPKLDSDNKVPNIVHFIWFGEPLNITSFLHYLALRSVASIQRPQSIYLHYNADLVVRSEHFSASSRTTPYSISLGYTYNCDSRD